MISVCIPIYNYDVRQLVEELSKQLNQLEVASEIILIDDCSTPEFKKINEDVCSKFRYIQLNENVGRAKIRNLFLEYATFDFLLFLDCDSMVMNPDFITNYFQELIQKKHKVICGGRIYPEKWSDKNRMLRWKYGVQSESQSFEIRRLNPNKSFMTNNFLIHRTLLSSIKFDESLTGYGHEDTLFGYLLKINKIEIFHIDNPVLNGDIETNDEFLKKTETGIENLCKITTKLKFNQEFINDVALLSFNQKLKKYHLILPIRGAFYCFKSMIGRAYYFQTIMNSHFD